MYWLYCVCLHLLFNAFSPKSCSGLLLPWFLVIFFFLIYFSLFFFFFSFIFVTFLAILFCMSFSLLKLLLIILGSLGSSLGVLSPAQCCSVSAFLCCSCREAACCPKQPAEKGALFPSSVERLIQVFCKQDGRVAKFVYLVGFPCLCQANFWCCRDAVCVQAESCKRSSWPGCVFVLCVWLVWGRVHRAPVTTWFQEYWENVTVSVN